MYWNYNQTMSHNKLFNFIVGNRGGGKSYGGKKYAINRFIKKGEQFVYLRRYDTELRKTKSSLFNDVGKEFENHDLKEKKGVLYCDDKVMGHCMALSTAKSNKSNSYPDVGTIIFDEFLLDSMGYQRYLPDEVVCFLEFYETIARIRDVRVLFLGNALSFTNPYFLYFDLKPPTAKNNVYSKGDILIQLVQDQDFMEMKKETRFGKIISGTDYGEYNIENKFMRDNDSFVREKMGEGFRHLFVLRSKGVNLGVWYNKPQGEMFISENYEPTCKMIYTIFLDNHEENTQLLSRVGESHYLKLMRSSYGKGSLFFSSVKAKNIAIETLKKIM